MSNNRAEGEKLAALHDALVDSLVQATDAEVLEELVLLGFDPTTEASRVKGLMLGAVQSYQQTALRDARAAYDALSQRAVQPSQIPNTPTERRNLFSLVLAKQPQYAELFTAQNRGFTDLTDGDIESYLEDLAELGVLEKVKVGAEDGSK